MISFTSPFNSDGKKKYYTIGEVADLLGMCASTVKRKVREGKILAVRISPRDHYRIPLGEWERLKRISEEGWK